MPLLFPKRGLSCLTQIPSLTSEKRICFATYYLFADAWIGVPVTKFRIVPVVLVIVHIICIRIRLCRFLCLLLFLDFLEYEESAATGKHNQSQKFREHIRGFRLFLWSGFCNFRNRFNRFGFVSSTGLVNTSIYYKGTPISDEELACKEIIDHLHTDNPAWGARQMSAQLKARGYHVGRRKARRYMNEMDIYPIYPKMNLSKRMQQAKVCPYLLRNAVIDKPNQARSIDITYIPIKRGFLDLTAVIDWHSRWADNIMIERWFRSFKYEEAYLTQYNNIKEARTAIGQYIRTYNFERHHSALDYQTPAECYYPAMLLPYVA